MQVTELIARLEELITDGTVTTTIYKLNGEWTSILVRIEEYNGKTIVTVFDNKGNDYVSRKIAEFDKALHPEKYIEIAI